MSPRRRLLRACVLAFAIHAGANAAWPLLHAAYAALFRLGVRGTAAPIASATATTVHVTAGRPDEFDTEIQLQNRASGRVGVLRMDSRFNGYLPNAILVALALSTPIAWKRRVRVLVLGSLLVNACIAIRIAIRTLLLARTVDAVALAPAAAQTLVRVEETFAIGTSGSLVMPACIWIMVVAGDWNALRWKRA